MDHLTPRAKGGVTTIDNIAPACEPCNQLKADRNIWVMLSGSSTD